MCTLYVILNLPSKDVFSVWLNKITETLLKKRLCLWKPEWSHIRPTERTVIQAFCVLESSWHITDCEKLLYWVSIHFVQVSIIFIPPLIRVTSWENLFLPYANNKGADQPAQISAFVVRCLDSIIPLVSISEISSIYLAPVTAQAGLNLPGHKLPKTGFLATRLILWVG